VWRSFSEQSNVSGSVESHAVSSPATAAEEAEHEDTAADRSRMGQRIPPAQEEQPSTSSGVQIDRVSQDRQGLFDLYVIIPLLLNRAKTLAH